MLCQHWKVTLLSCIWHSELPRLSPHQDLFSDLYQALPGFYFGFFFLSFCYFVLVFLTARQCSIVFGKKKKNLQIQERFGFLSARWQCFLDIRSLIFFMIFFIIIYILYMLQSRAAVGTLVLCVLSCVWTGQRTCTHTHVQSVCKEIASWS